MLRPRRSVGFVRRLVSLALLLGLLVPALPAAAQAPAAPPREAPAVQNGAPAERAAAPVVAAPIDPAVSSAVPCGPSAPSGELAQLRTRTSRTYQAAGGAYQTVACPGSVNYPDSTGAWQPIDNTLVAATASRYAYQNAANSFSALFPATLNGAPIKVSKGSLSVAFALVGAQAAGASASGSTVTYPSALAGVSASYTVLNDGVKENLTLASATAPSSFTFNVTLSPGLTARQNVAGGVDFVDATGVAQLSFAPPYAADSSSAPGSSAGTASLSLAQAGSALTVTLAASPTWLASPARAWPVVLDPQITLSPTADCYLKSGSGHATSYCSGTGLGVGSDGTSIYRSLLQFDLSAVPYDATIGDASLQLRLGAASGAGSSAVEAHRITQAWTSNVTWDTYDGTHAWASPGGDFYATPHDTETVAVGGVGTWYAWGIVPLAQAWVNGTVANQGVLLKEASEATANLYVFNSARTANPPALKVNWKHWTGLLPYWTYFSHGLTDRSDLAVNVANGNLTFHDRDLTIGGTGLPLSLDRFYNGDENGTQDVGAAWTLDYGLGFNLNSTGNSGIVLTGPNDYSVFFQHNKQTGAYVTPAGLDADLVQNGDSTFTLTWHATGTKDTFGVASPNGVSSLTSVVDRNGNAIALAYNGDGTVHTVTDTQGRVVTFSYGTFNGKTFVQYVTDWTGRQVQYGYNDANHNLTDYYDALNNHTVYTYSGNSLTQIDDARGNRTKIVYGNPGQAVQSITFVTNLATNAGLTYNFTYHRGSTPNTVVTDPNNVATTYFYDALGRVTKVSDPQGNSQQFAWTSDNHLATHTDAYSHTTTYTYSTDGNNNLTKIQLPNETVNGQPVTGASVSWAYTDASHPFYPTSLTDAQSNVTSYTYDTPGNLKTVTDALASQNQEQLFYNANGTIDHVINFNGNTTSYSYDAKGNLIKVTPPTTTMPSPGAPLGPTSITPDSLSRPHVVTDGASKQTTTTFDAQDRPTLVTYNDASTIAYNLDADGNLTSMVENGTTTTSYSYDRLNRKAAKTPPGQAAACSYTLPDGTVVSGAICYQYDGASNLTSLTDAGGAVSYGYNGLDELATLTEPGSSAPQTSFGYDNNHNRTTTTFPGSSVETATYDNAQRVTEIKAVNGATVLDDLTYSYQVGTTDTMLTQTVGRSDSSNDNSTATNGYDVLNRLTSWVVTVPQGSALRAHTYTYGYDGNGNRTSIVADGATTTNAFNAANEWTQAVTSLGTANYYWDAAGNELGNDGRGNPSQALHVTYNAKNQLATITDTQQNIIPMAYTGPGEAERASAGWASSNPATPWGTNTFTYGSGMLSQTNATGVDQGTIRYTREPDGTLVSQRVPNAASNYYYLLDKDGSVIRLIDSTGGVQATYVYCPTGNPLSDLTMGPIALNQPYRYLGMYYDPGTQTYYDAFFVDSNSGIQLQLCPLPIGGLVFPCLAPLPAQTTTHATMPCPGPDQGDGVTNGVPGASNYQRVSGPEQGYFGCHINVVSGHLNQHIYWDQGLGEYFSAWTGVNPDLGGGFVYPIGSTPAEAETQAASIGANWIISHSNPTPPSALAAYYFIWYVTAGNVGGRLLALQNYY